MSFRRAILVACLGLGACGRGEIPRDVSPSAAPASPPPHLLSLPDLPDPADPRRAWLRELTGPRLTRMASLTWSCPAESPALLLELAPLGVNCEDFLKANFPAPPPRGKATRTKVAPAVCVAAQQLRIALHAKSCAKDEIQSLLGRLRLPSGAGLYEAQGAQKFRPQAANLPELELSAEPTPGARRLATPDFRAWLPAALSKGAVVMALVPVHGAYSESLIHSLTRNAASFLGRIRPPKHFRPNVEFTALAAVPATPSPSPGGRPEDNKPPLMSLSTAHQDPLLQQSCFYVSQWIRARQLLAPEGEVQNARELAFRCVFLWAEDFEAAPEGLISVARLPLPLATEDGSFPFKSADEALSPSLLQSLRAAR